MGRTLTLRGEITPFSQETPLNAEGIFQYESAGTKRAWKVTSWSMWPTDFGETQAWTEGTNPVHRFILTTDSGMQLFRDGLAASENRTIGWNFTTSTCGKNQQNLSPIYRRAELDPDHLVTGQLFISAAAFVESSDNALLSTWSYMVKLESRTITPAESIMQTLKGRGQDVAT